MTIEYPEVNWWNTPAADRANRLIDTGRTESLGLIVPAPEGNHPDNVTWVSFDSVVVDGEPGAIVAIETQLLIDAGIDPSDGDPLDDGRVWVWADVAIEVDGVDEILPADFRRSEWLTPDDIKAFENPDDTPADSEHGPNQDPESVISPLGSVAAKIAGIE